MSGPAISRLPPSQTIQGLPFQSQHVKQGIFFFLSMYLHNKATSAAATQLKQIPGHKAIANHMQRTVTQVGSGQPMQQIQNPLMQGNFFAIFSSPSL